MRSLKFVVLGILSVVLILWALAAGKIGRVSLAQGQQEQEIGCTFRGPSSVTSLTFSPDGRMLASGHADGTIKLWPVGVIVSPLSGKAEGFELGCFLGSWLAGGDAFWRVISGERRSGNYSARAGIISHNQTSWLEVSGEARSGKVAFWLKVSSESGYDYLRFYIDGVEKGRWSGSVSWQQTSYEISAGIHTFKWAYTKDGGGTSGEDTAWIDDITFP